MEIENFLAHSISEIVSVCEGHPATWRRRAAREGWPHPAGAYVFLIAGLPRDLREKISAHRERRRRGEQADLMEGCPILNRPDRNELSLTESQRAIGLARAHLVMWIDDIKSARGLNDQQAVVRAVIHSEEDRDCNFRLLLNQGQQSRCAINYANLTRWRSVWNRYRRHARDWANWHMIAPRNRGPAPLTDPNDRAGDSRYWHHIALLYEHRNGLDLVDAWNAAKRAGTEKAWGEHPSYGQVTDWYRRKTDRAALLARRKGEKFIYNVLDTSARRDWSEVQPGDIWYADHHLCNTFVRVARRDGAGWYSVRPTLTLFLDVPSMHVVGYILRAEKGDGDVILQAWQRAVCDTGFTARTVVFDNGKDYRSIGGRAGRNFSAIDVDKFSTTGAILGCRVSFKLPHNARSSPCELWFAQMNDFEQGWTTFSGKNAAEVSAIWPALCRQKLAKFGGDDSDPMKGCLVNPDLVPTLDEYRSEFDRWLREDRELRKSNGIMLDGKTPAQAWNSGAGVPPVSPVSGAGVPPVASSSVEPRGIPVSDRTRFVAFLRAFGKPQCVGKGCTVLFKRSDSQRSWIRYHSRALEPWLLSGEEVLVKISTEDISHAYVFQWIEAAGWKLIDCGGPDGGCPSIADIPANTGTEQVREITRQNRARRKAIRDGLNAEEQEAAFDDLRRGGLVPRDATNTEILLAGGTCSVVADVVAARRKTAADRKALIKELESGLSKDDLNNY